MKLIKVRLYSDCESSFRTLLISRANASHHCGQNYQCHQDTHTHTPTGYTHPHANLHTPTRQPTHTRTDTHTGIDLLKILGANPNLGGNMC